VGLVGTLGDRTNFQNQQGRALESLMKESRRCVSITAEQVESCGRHDDDFFFSRKNCDKNKN